MIILSAAQTRPLSPRQAQIITLLAEGFEHKEAARHLGISLGAVKRHMELARAKLGARNGAHAVALCLTSVPNSARGRPIVATEVAHEVRYGSGTDA